MRKQNLLAFVLLALSLPVLSQQSKPGVSNKPQSLFNNPVKKYPSLLWEISGNGLKKPSYLFGTMHVSDKLVFHLGDSFYNAIRACDVVALETNPENWQDDYSESAMLKSRGRGFGNFLFRDFGATNDNMLITSFMIDTYDEAIKASLAVDPAMINGFLYRTYGNRMADFEEDTYLDLHIFQTGKKLGKRLAGVENFKESEKLVIEAYRDMYKDEKRKRKSFDYEGMFSNPKMLEDAYRRGDLDVLDSLEELDVTSYAFQEKFLYKRNEIQARSADSIMKKASLFVAVGAAHLPGKRGVIELLRSMGYIVRPVKMDVRNSRQKEQIEKIHFNTGFVNQQADDGFYQVSIPGKKFYSFTEWSGMDVKQFADMANGSYYMVTRVKTNSLYQGHSNDRVYKKIDSLLYENVPGKILRKTPITKNGYKGWEIINRTRRGDHQQYHIYVTPFEIIVFKMSGNGEYIKEGDEAKRFFSSIKLKEYNESAWSNFQPQTGGFSVQLPHKPSLLRDENTGTPRLEYAAHDQQNSYLIMQSSFHHLLFAEEDSFELNLIDESYAYSPFIDKQLSRRFITSNKYPGLESKYLHKDGSYSSVKYFIRGPIYYMVAAHYPEENENAKKFLSSFSMQPFIYPETKTRTDTSLHFTVQSPFFPDEKEKTELEKMLELLSFYRYADDDEDETDLFEDNFKFKWIGNDTLGEKVFVNYRKPDNYTYVKDSVNYWKNNFRTDEYDFDEDEDTDPDSSFIYRLDKRFELPGGIKCRELQLSDTGSSRLILEKYFYKNGHVFSVFAVTDTFNSSPFLSRFFSSFSPSDTLKGESLFTKKTERFFNDYFSTDSITAKKARKAFTSFEFDTTDAPLIRNAIEKLNWQVKDYITAKTRLINELGDMKDSTVTPYLRQLYFKVKDSSDFQNAILKALLAQRTKESFIAFKDLILQEPPIETDESDYYDHIPRISFNGGFSSFIIPQRAGKVNYHYGNQWYELYDTMKITRHIFPEFLQLMNVDDYKSEVMDLLVAMVDSGYLKEQDYESYFSKIYLDAKQLLKKQNAREESDNIEKETRKGRKKSFYDDEDEDETLEEGNSELKDYSILLMPFYDKNSGVKSFFEQLLKTKDRELLYDIFILMLRNNKPLHDSLFIHYAKLDEYRVKLYDDLKEMKKTEKFPGTYKKQQDFARSIYLTGANSYDKPDSLTYIDRLPVTYENKKGWVYFFKYKEERDDNFWQLACVGMQPEKEDSVDTENDEFTDNESRKIDPQKPIKEQMEKMLKEQLFAKRKSASMFYTARRYNVYKNYLSEIVKRGRYGD